MADDGKLRVLTLNAWGIPFLSKDRVIRIACIADELSKGLYDIVSLQEVWSYSDYELIGEKVQGVLPFSHYFQSGVIGSGVCVFSHYPITDVLTCRYFPNGYMYKIQHGDWFGGKALGLCIIRHPKQRIHFFATHLHASYTGESYIHHRVSQAYQMSRFIQHVAPPAGVTLLCGDMNCTPSDLCYRIIRDVGGLQDSWLDHVGKESQSGNTCDVGHNSYTTYKAGTDLNGSGQRIDYIFYRGNGDDIKCTDSKVTMGRIPGKAISFSDHEGVAATFLLKESEPEFPAAAELPLKSECSTTNLTETLLETKVVLSEGSRLRTERSLKRTLTACVLGFVILLPFFLSYDTSQNCLVHTAGVLSAVALAAYLYYVVFNAYEEVNAYGNLQKMADIQIKYQCTVEQD